MSIEIGKKAPSFTLLDASSHSVSLSDLRGHWVVIYFYPKDDTPGCTMEACEFTDSMADFTILNANIIGISPDSPASHAKFAAKHGLSVTLLSDPERKVLNAYGAWGKKVSYGKETTGVIRSTVILDPEGTIVRHWPKVSAKGHAEEVKKALALLQAAKES